MNIVSSIPKVIVDLPRLSSQGGEKGGEREDPEAEEEKGRALLLELEIWLWRPGDGRGGAGGFQNEKIREGAQGGERKNTI